jgi:hypothetical protein
MGSMGFAAKSPLPLLNSPSTMPLEEGREHNLQILRRCSVAWNQLFWIFSKSIWAMATIPTLKVHFGRN